MFGTKNQM